MKKSLGLLLSLALVLPAAAKDNAARPRFIEPLGVVVSYGGDSGNEHKAGKIGCENPGNCIDYNLWSVGADLFTAFSFASSGNRGISFGPWVGQDIGHVGIGGTGSMFGITNIGGVLYVNFADMMQYYLAAGYGLAYSDIDSPDFKMKNKFSASPAFITGISITPFHGTWFAPLGFNYSFKFTSHLPDIYGQTPQNAGKYGLALFSSFGIFIKF